ncbi:protein-glutamate O-methyltransferase CheR [Patescibacteria group bacterium]|nr:protein-glutamate O-methyltransferase CheR [Patescibacteria group bacterium]
MPISDAELQILIEKIAIDHNWDLGSYKWPTLKRRVKARMVDTDCFTPEKYYKFIEENEEEYKKLINSLTVNFTSWFRDEGAWEWVLKIMSDKALKNEQIRIWSAGCSTGEEAYSLAILAKKIEDSYAGCGNRKPKFVIYASDIDKVALETAKKGVYAKDRMNIDDSELSFYFDEKEGLFSVKEEIKRLVRFSVIDLVKDDYPKDMDLILCRNVMIYFSKDLQAKVFENFYYALRDSGFLITGKVEVMPMNINHLFEMINVSEHVFKKK